MLIVKKEIVTAKVKNWKLVSRSAMDIFLALFVMQNVRIPTTLTFGIRVKWSVLNRICYCLAGILLANAVRRNFKSRTPGSNLPQLAGRY